MGGYKRIMEKIILDAKLTPERKEEFKEFKTNKLQGLLKGTDTILDYYNHLIIFLKGESVLTWYTPCDPTKDKEPWLNRKLTDKWKPTKTVAQKDRLKEERTIMATKILAEGPIEKEKRKKKEKDVKVVRVIKRWHCKLYTCNAGRLSNKMAILAHDAQKLKLGVIHISEAGVGPAAPMGLSGYTVIKLERSGPNRGSLMYIRNFIYPRCLRIFDPKKEEEETGAEIMQIQIDTVPPTSIFGVYLETGKPVEAKEHAHKMLQKRVEKCTKKGHNVIMMGDFNAPVNDSAMPHNVAAKKILEWEKTGEIKILNNKQIPTRVPPRKGDRANCLDLMIITKGLENRTSNYALDTEHEWSPAATQTKNNINGGEVAYLRGKPTDHKAQTVTLLLDLVEKGQAGNRAIINYNNRDGWKLYYKVSNKYAPQIMQTVRTFTDKNELQKEFKNIMHAIDIECFGIKYKKCRKVVKKMSKRKHEAVKELSDIVKEHKKMDLDVQERIKAEKSLSMKIKIVDEVIMGPKHKVPERTALFDPKTAELLTD